ncbi:MAG TPA: carbohydrate kinase family protein [Bacillales bacterium]|nr:carbohydrate kinase family protein [Bacillales bacterium]
MITVIGDLVADILVSSQGAANYATDTEGSIQLRAGGQGNHVAAWIAAAGRPSRLIGKVGEDPFGSFLLEEVEKNGVTCSVTADPRIQTGKIVILIEENTGERSMITDRGANLHLCSEDIEGIEDSQLLYISGYSWFAPGPRRAVELAKRIALSNGVPITVDPSSTYYLKENKEAFLEFLDGVTFLFPNYEEGRLLTGEEDPEKIVSTLQNYVRHPVLKLGSEGCLVCENRAIVKIPGKKTKAVDATGAGDSFTGTFLAAYVKTESLTEAAYRAVAVSSKVVSQIGARPVF